MVVVVDPPTRPAYGTYKPDASTTGIPDPSSPPLPISGVPAGTSYNTTTGDLTVTGSGVTLDSIVIPGRLRFAAGVTDFTLSNFWVRGLNYTSTTAETALVDCNPAGLKRIVLRDGLLAAEKPIVTMSGILGHDFTAERLDISGVVDGIGAYNNTGTAAEKIGPTGVQILAPFIHDLVYISPDPNQSNNATHNDGIQVQGGTGTLVVGANLDMRGSSVLNDLAASGSTSGGVANTRAPNLGQAFAVTPNVSDIEVTMRDCWADYGFRVLGAVTTASYGATVNITGTRCGPGISTYPAGSGGTGGTVRRTLVLQPSVVAPGLPTVNASIDTQNGNVDTATGQPTAVWRQTP